LTRRPGPWAGIGGGEAAELVDVVLATLAAGVGLALLPGWLLAGVAGLVHTGRWPHLRPVDTLAGLAGWAGHLADPRAGYPGSLRTALPGPVGMYGAAAVTLLILAGAVAAGWLLVRRLGLPTFRVGRSGAGFATAVDVRTALSATAVRRRAAQTRPSLAGRRADPRQLGLFLGRDIRSGQALYGSVEDSYLYLGPPRSGKGVHLIIPQALDAPGPVLVTATRPDTLRHTLARRAASGPVAVFDPQGLAGPVPRLRWAPQGGCADPLTAIGRARALAAGAALSAGTVTGGEFWQAMTEAVLRCYLHAAALESLPMTEVLGWAARPGDPAPVRVLRRHPDAASGWAEELAAQAGADPRQRDSVWAGVRRATDALADPRVLAACSPPPAEAFDPAGFLAAGGSLYLLGSSGVQLSVAPLVTALVEDLVEAARRQAARSPAGRLDPPLLALLDEAANIAPIPSLPALLADGGGSGITTVAVLQSLAQARARWGIPAADAMWDAATTKVVLGGLAHADDLARIARLAGDRDEPTRSASRGPGGASTTMATRRAPVLPIEALRCLPAGQAIVLARRSPPVRARLTPWWRRADAAQIRAALADGPGFPAEARE
jgi:type IV secretion system protein VirD4